MDTYGLNVQPSWFNGKTTVTDNGDLRAENDALKAALEQTDRDKVAANIELGQARADVKSLKAELATRFTAPIVCMCGSTRFRQAWLHENARLTYEGNIVLSVGLFAHADGKMAELEASGMKVKLDDLHKRKIDLCDWVWVLDVGGYIGDSTRSEIAYAEAHGKPVRFLSREYPDYAEPEDPFIALRAALAATQKERDTWCDRARYVEEDIVEGLKAELATAQEAIARFMEDNDRWLRARERYRAACKAYRAELALHKKALRVMAARTEDYLIADEPIDDVVAVALNEAAKRLEGKEKSDG